MFKKTIYLLMLLVLFLCSLTITAAAEEICPAAAGNRYTTLSADRMVEKRLTFLPDRYTVVLEIFKFANPKVEGPVDADVQNYGNCEQITYIGNQHYELDEGLSMSYMSTRSYQDSELTSFTCNTHYNRLLIAQKRDSNMEITELADNAQGGEAIGYYNDDAKMEYCSEDVVIFKLNNLAHGSVDLKLDVDNKTYRYEVMRVVYPNAKAHVNEQVAQFNRSFADGYFVTIYDTNNNIVNELIVDYGVHNIYKETDAGMQHLFSDEAVG